MANNNSQLIIPQETRERQANATDPSRTVWVSANAGSGKTYVLAIRVIRLLLKGVKPAELLCLTFTKAAAAEMSNRVFKMLGNWVSLDDQELSARIREITGETPDRKLLTQARRLFALALDTPGGLKIQTIHGFCGNLLHRFALEANVPANFTELDDHGASKLLDEARRNVLGFRNSPNATASSRKQQEAVFEAFTVLQEHASESKIEDALKEIIGKRHAFEDWLRGRLDEAMGDLRERLDMAPGETETSILDSARLRFPLSETRVTEWREIFAAHSATTAGKIAKRIDTATDTASTETWFTNWTSFLLGSKDKPLKHLVSPKFTDDNGLRGEFELLQEFFLDVKDRIKTLKTFQASEALFRVAFAILQEYANLKQRRAVLDFDDLIGRTANLLTRAGIRDWIQYKLDLGIRHVLVDEAQDTSPLQWQIIQAITGEFFAGEGVHDENRTLFVVGDEKQSIYSFQGADPEEFHAQRNTLVKRLRQTSNAETETRLTHSFRSTEEVLSAVDHVFSFPENARGLAPEGEAPNPHTALRHNAPGEVLVWAPEAKHEKMEKEGWRDPLDRESETDAEVRLARRITDDISANLGKPLPGTGKPVRPRDILVLVRRRDRFITALSRELKTAGIPTAGADRLNLTEHIFAEDMMALGKFALMNSDDLSLAGILKSPVFGFDEYELLTLASSRGNRTLIENMGEAAHGKIPGCDGDFRQRTGDALNELRRISELGRSSSPYEFYANVFARLDLRSRYLNRLGHEVEDIMDGFLAAALQTGNNTGGGLTGFIEWLTETNPELKRQVDMETDEVRIITVHSAKGLEAPIVYLVDPGTQAFNSQHAPSIIGLDRPGTGPFMWIPVKSDRIKSTEASFGLVEKAAEEEYRRLLYVGMTRAEDRLVVCGYHGTSVPKHDHWLQMVRDALSTAAPVKSAGRNGQLVPAREDGGEVRSWRWVVRETPAAVREDKGDSGDKDTSVAAADLERLRIPALSEPHPPKPLNPSGVMNAFDIDAETGSASGEASRFAIDRGNAIHSLLQVLPDIDPDQREAVATAMLGASFAHLPVELTCEIIHEALAVLSAPELEFCFGTESTAETGIAGHISLGTSEHTVRGQIDRLVDDGRRILIVDYKTNRRPPEQIDYVPPAYVAQMALYRDLARSVWPDRKIECAIIWTVSASILHLPDETLSAAVSGLGGN